MRVSASGNVARESRGVLYQLGGFLRGEIIHNGEAERAEKPDRREHRETRAQRDEDDERSELTREELKQDRCESGKES